MGCGACGLMWPSQTVPEEPVPVVNEEKGGGGDGCSVARGAVPSRCSFCGHRARQQPSEILLLQARRRGRGAGSRTGLTAAPS